MLSKEIFTLEYIRELQNRYKKDPGLLERVMYAFGLLEALAQVGMKYETGVSYTNLCSIASTACDMHAKESLFLKEAPVFSCLRSIR